MNSLFDPIKFSHGPAMKNRVVMAPITNWQSHEDGHLSDDEYNWLTMRANAGFGLTMTCAAHVQAGGKGFPGQLGFFSDDLLPGLTRLANGIREGGSIAIAQLYHGGMRASKELTGVQPVSASALEKYGTRALSTEEVDQLIEDFILGAIRAEKAGFDGVEVHGAHGYLLCQFLSPELNQRDDKYGGSLENRARIIFDIIDGIRSRCRDDFNVSVRLSPERFGMKIAEVIEVARRLLADGKIDFLDMSLWDFKKDPEEEEFKGRSLMSYFTELDRGDVKLAVAGKIMSAADCREAIEGGADFVMAGRAGILHHDFVKKLEADTNFTSIDLPVTRAHLENEGLNSRFLDYMASWDGFVAK
ncbi:NADH:flavin oxidoreductase [Alphaproteobacteria bacterium 46_93_T64]|nr:NADH:flavin oxidoreductase [Alphaproteobacteria bacterium 46_93_T64]